MWNWQELQFLSYTGWWPSFSDNAKVKLFFKFLGIILCLLDVIHVLQEIIGFFSSLTHSNFQEAINSLTITFCGIMCAFKIGTLILYRGKIAKLIAKIDELNERGLIALKSDGSMINANHYKICWALNLLMKIFLAFTIHWLVRPLWRAVDGEKTMIVGAWIPWSLTSWIEWAFLYTLQSIHFFSACVGWYVLDGLYLVMLEVILANFNMLKFALNKLDFKNQKERNLDFCIKFHKELLQVCKELNEVLLVNLTIQCGCYVIIVCLTIFQLSNLLDNFGSIETLNLLELVCGMTFTLFFFSIQCQRVTDGCSDLGRDVYMNNWYEANKNDKMELLIFVERTRRPQIFGTVLVIELATFITVVKTAFSYYNILIALEIN